MKVLIVEDEPRTARAIMRLVNQRPGIFCVGSAMNGEEALAIMKKNPADLIITDIRMPVMDGVKLLEALHLAYPQCLTVVLSGYSQFEYAKAAMQYQAFDYLLKPINRDDLFSLLDRAELAWQTQTQTRRHVLFSRVMAGEAPDSDEALQIFACLIRGGKPRQEQDPYLRQCFDRAYPYAGFSPTEQLLLLDEPEEAREQLQAYFHLVAEGSSAPMNMVFSREPVALSALRPAIDRLRRAMEHEPRLFQSGLFPVDCTGATPRYGRSALRDMHPEQIAEAISMQDRPALLQGLTQMLQNAGVPAIDVQRCLEAVLSDARIALQTAPVSLSEKKQALWDVLFAATEPQACAEALAEILLPSQETAVKRAANIAETIVRQIHANYHLPFSMEALARQYGFTPGHLNKIFKQHTGVRPTEYLLKLRMERAKQMLETKPDMLIKDVAAGVGYSDHQYFSKVFKKETGLWPSECQRQAKR